MRSGLLIAACFGGLALIAHSVGCQPRGKPVTATPGTAHSGTASADLAPLIEALRKAETPAARTDALRRLYVQGPEGKAFLVSAFVDPDLHEKFQGGNREDQFCVGWGGIGHTVPPKGKFSHLCSLGHISFTDVRNGKFNELNDLDAMVDKALASDNSYVDHYLWCWQHFVGYDKADYADELVNPDSTPGSRRLGYRYLLTYERLDLQYDPTAPIEAMPVAARQELQKWKEENYEESHWQWWDQRQLVGSGRHTFVKVLKEATGEELENLALSALHDTGHIFHSQPGEFQFGISCMKDEAEEALGLLLQRDTYRSRACLALWQHHSRLYARQILDALAKSSPEDLSWYEARKAIEESLAPASIRSEMEKGDFAWGAWLAALRPHESFVPILLDRLNNPKTEKDYKDLGESPHALELRTDLRDYDVERQRTEAIFALGCSKDPRAREPLLKWVHSEDRGLTGISARALGYLGDPSVEPELIAALKIPNGWIRCNASFALGMIGTRKAIPALRPIADERTVYGDVEICGVAKQAINKIEAREKAAGH